MNKIYSRFFVLLAFALFGVSACAMAELMSVKTSKANIRSQPGADAEIVWTAWKFTPLEILERKGKWAHVRDFANYTGWIHTSVLVKTPTVTVKAKVANLRSGPGSDKDVVWEVDKEFSFKVLGKKNGWYNVTDENGTEGWISKGLLWGSL
ncbi:MAG: SH3 domain-containing protein [Elusimicrobiaceae bacterium]